jgi:hypothetical protein
MIDSVWLRVLDFGHRLQDVGQKGKDVNNDENGFVDLNYGYQIKLNFLNFLNFLKEF